jgi:hypothetical protein
MWGSIIGLADYASNRIGGVTLSNHDIAMSGTIIGSTANTSNVIGGVLLSNSNIYAGSGKLRISNIHNALGDGQTYAFQEIVSGLSSVAPPSAPAISFQESIGGYRHFIRSRHDYFDGNAQNLASNAIDFYTNTSTDATASTGPGTGNALAMSVTSAGVGIGTDNIGYALNVSGTAYASEGVIASNFTTLNASSNRIGGVILDNSNTTSSNFTTPTASSNDIGGVTLSNNNIAMSGTIIGSTANTSNQIGGVTLSNNNIAMSGTIIGSTANTSNQIGGVTLSNNNVAMSGTIIGSTANTSNQIGGVTLSNRFMLLQNASGQRRWGFGVSNTETGYNYGSDYKVTRFDDAGNEITGDPCLAITRFNGCVGIGTSEPNEQLEVNGGSIQVRNPSAGTIGSAYTNGLTFRATNELSQDRFAIARIVPTLDAANNVFGLSFQTNTNTATGITEKMRLTGGGNLGIGTTTPAQKLEVTDGNIQVRNTTTSGFGTAFSNGITFRATNESSVDIGTIAKILPTLDGGDRVLGLSFHTNTNTATGITEKMRLTGNGRLGLGTSTLSNYNVSIRGNGGTSAAVVFHSTASNIPFVGVGYDQPNESIAFHVNNGSSDLNSTPMHIKRVSGFVGIGTSAPAYQLDVSAGTTAASINMSAWPRSAISFSHIAVGNVGMGSTATVCMLFSNAKVSLNSNLGEITNDSVSGTYFVCKRSGIWSITYGCRAGAATVATAIDVSTGITDNATAGSAPARSLALMATGNAVSFISYTGYLPSNTGYYYKFKLNSPNAANSNEAKLQITFMCEQPNVTGYPL